MREKKILDLKIECEGQTFVVPVKAAKAYDAERGDKAMSFHAIYEPAGINEWNTDIRKLEEKVTVDIKNWASVDWKPYILITIGGGHQGQKGGYAVKFTFEFYVIGTDKLGSELFMEIPRPDDVRKFKPEKFTRWGLHEPRKGRPKTGDRETLGDYHYAGNPETISLVPMTPENVAAVDHFTAALKHLSERMHDVFGPDKVQQILLTAAQHLLPAPEE